MTRSPLAAAFALIVASPALAVETGAWTSNGPPGASVYCIVPAPSSPSVVYVGTGRGVWRGERGGLQWRPASEGLPAVRVQAIAVDRTDADTLFAGTLTPSDGSPSDGIFKSVDGGATWLESNDGLRDPFTFIEPLDVPALSIDPSDPQVILAGTRFSEIFRSTDGGASWTPRTLGGFGINLETTAFARDPGDSQRVFAASSRGLLLSENGGASWGFFGDAGISFYSLAIDPASPSTMYAGNLNGFGIARSTDGGQTWSLANGNLPTTTVAGQTFFPAITAIVIAPAGGTLSIATQSDGLFRSNNGGGTWTAVDVGLNEVSFPSLAYLADGVPTLLAGGNGGGVYRTTDEGAHWSTSSFGLNEALVAAVVVNPGAPGVAYAADYDGVYATEDGAASWTRASGGLPPLPVAALALRFAVSLQPGDQETLYAGTLGEGLFASTDGGASWSPLGTGLADDYVSALTVDPTNAQTIYAGTDHPFGPSQRVYKSTDAGATWRQTGLDAGPFPIDGIAVDPDDSSRVAAVSHGGAGYFQSTNGGNTWTVVAPGLVSGCGNVLTLHYETPGNGILLGVTNGVCRSSNGGVTWTRHPVTTSGSVYDLLADPLDASVVYAAVSPAFHGGTGGVFRSADGGLTWSVLGTGLETYEVRSLALDASREILYAGILRGGVARLALGETDRTTPDPVPSHRTTQLVPPR